MKKTAIISALIFVVILVGCAKNNNEEAKINFPEQPIELIVPYTAGGGADLTARVITQHISKYLPNKQTVTVINKPGGAGVIGVADVFRAKPDGYTLGIVSNTPLTIQPHISETPYKYNEFKLIGNVINEPLIIAVQSGSQWTTFEEWLTYVEANPGEFTYGVVGAGGSPQIALESLTNELGLKAKAVVYEGGGEMTNALLGGHINGAVIKAGAIMQHVKAGTLKILASSGTKVFKDLENTPLFSDKAPGIFYENFTGIVAPKGTPEEIVNILIEALKKTVEDPEVIEGLEKLGTPPSYEGPTEFEKKIEGEYILNKKTLEEIGLIK